MDEINNFKIFCSIIGKSKFNTFQEEQCTQDECEADIQRTFLRRQGFSDAQIQEKLELSNPDTKSLNIGGMLADDSAKPWPLAKKLKIDWHIPQDVKRVMLFERLQYMVEEKRRAADADLNPDKRELQLELIAKIKQLYPQKLAMLKSQLSISRA